MKKARDNMGKLKVAVVGDGDIGLYHARMYNQLENAELIAMVDKNEEFSKSTSKLLSCNYYNNIDDLLANENIEAIDICVPDQYHMEPTIKAAKAGKHILLQKPIAKTVFDAENIKNICLNNGIRLMIGQTCRFANKYRKLHEIINNGEIGEVSELSISRYTYRSVIEYLKGSTSILYYIGVHDIDAVQWYTGKKIIKVFAKETQKISTYSEDSIVFMFELENGAVGTFHLGWNMPDSYGYDICKINIIGTKSATEINMCETGFQIYTPRGKQEVDTSFLAEIYGSIKGAYYEEISHFVDSVINNKEFLIPIEEAIDSIRVIEGILKSVKTGKEVEINR